MPHVFARRASWLFATAAALALAACSNGSSAGGTAGNGSDGQAQGGAAGAGASSINACRLLTKAEIQQQLGVASVDDGKLQTTDSQANCDWTGKGAGDNEVGLTVRVQDFDQDLWNSFTTSSRARPVSGLGEAAFANVPLAGGLMIRQGKYEIDVGVVDFKISNDRAVAAATALAAIALRRLSESAGR
jgi:hypothetical protein